MSATPLPVVTPQQRKIFRELVRRRAEIAARPEMEERIRLWKLHNALRPERPMLLLFPEGGWSEIAAAHPAEMECVFSDPVLRAIEWDVRAQLYMFEHFPSDNVVTAGLDVPKRVVDNGWGLSARWIHSDAQGGARKFDPVVRGPGDLARMRHPRVTHDAAASAAWLGLVQELAGDLVPVRLRGIGHISFHLMSLWTSLRGLEEVMMDMVAEPEFLHEAMRFLEEGHRGLVRQYEELGLLELNNDNTYHSTGGNGWTDELPPPGFDPAHVRPRDMWASAEAQELTLVSPQMHWEFSMEYESRLLEPFALNGYACCDDLTLKLDHVKRLPRIRRISIAPAANVDRCMPQLGPGYICSWKPRPTDLVGEFRPDRIRGYLRHGLALAREHGCVLEMILKDTHTCENHPERFDRWAEIAREEVSASAG